MRAAKMGRRRPDLVTVVALAALLSLVCLNVMAQPAEKLTPDAYRLADAAYKALSMGNLPSAESYAARALAAQPDSQQLGLLLLDVYVREGKTADADTLAAKLLKQFPDSPQVLAQSGFLAQRQERNEMAWRYLSAALEKGQGQWTAEQQRSLRLAWADAALAAHRPDQATEALRPLENESDPAVQLRVSQTRLIEGDREGSLHAAELALSHASTEQDRSYAQALIDQAHSQAKLEHDDAARKTLQQAYDLLREHNDSEALDMFQRGFDAGAGNASNYADAAYAAKRTGDNPRSIALFKQSIDADDTEQIFDAQRRFGYKREVEQLERTWGFILSVPYQNYPFGAAGTVDVLQPGIEAYWQPPKIGYQDGRIFQLFVRGYGTAYDGSGGVTGGPTLQGSVGARYKPIADQNIVLTGERLVKIGNLAINDWLLRLGYSSEAGTDLLITEPSWRSWQAYAEGAYFVQEGRYIIYSELRYGHTWLLAKISDWLTVYPHLVVAGDHDNKAVHQTALGVGPGIQLRYWFRESRYRAPASWLDVTMQYRFPLTSAERARGLVVRAILWF
ncbi:bacteriophage N4 adsorption protein A [Pararobbsia alpina]